MPTNDRLIYSNVHASFQPDGSASIVPSGLHGLQSITLNTAYNSRDILELGQIDKYDTIEDSPGVTVTLEKKLDGITLIYHAATTDATGATLNARAINMKPTIFKAATFNQGFDAASGTPLAVVTCSGLYIDSLSYKFPTEGEFTETVSFVGTSKIWATGAAATNFAGQFGSGYFGGPVGPDTPASGVEVRQDLDMTNSRWPTQIQGITAGGVNTDSGSKFTAHIRNVEVSANLSRTDLFELGRKRAFYKLAKVPVDVTTSIEILTNEFMDVIDARDDSSSNVSNQTMRIRTLNGVDVYLGTKNTIQSVDWQGVDVAGNAFAVTFSYKNLNVLTVTQPTTQGDFKMFAYP